MSFSSLEHSGLGRYGDAFNPWGDRITMARMWCVLKPGGHALVGFAVSEVDTISFNAHRIYGPIMLPHILANYKLLWNSNPHFGYYTDSKGLGDLQAVFLVQAIK